MRQRLHRRPLGLRAQRGMILLTAVFIMVVLGLLASLLAANLREREAGTSLVFLAEQARVAAASGIEWGRNRALQAGICGTAQISIGEFAVTVSCTSEAIVEGAASYLVFDLEAEARRGTYGNPDFVRRSAAARVSNR